MKNRRTVKQADAFESTLPKHRLTEAVASNDSAQRVLLQAVQIEMLKTMGMFLKTPFPQVWYKVVSAKDLDSLWDIRVELMTELSKAQGEVVAKHLLSKISQYFNINT